MLQNGRVFAAESKNEHHIRAPDNRRPGGSSEMFCCIRWHYLGCDQQLSEGRA